MKHLLEELIFSAEDGTYKMFTGLSDPSRNDTIAKTMLHFTNQRLGRFVEDMKDWPEHEYSEENRIGIHHVLKRIFEGGHRDWGRGLSIPDEVMEHFKHPTHNFFFTETELWTKHGVITFPITGQNGRVISIDRMGEKICLNVSDNFAGMVIDNDFQWCMQAVMNNIEQNVSDFRTLVNARAVTYVHNSTRLHKTDALTAPMAHILADIDLRTKLIAKAVERQSMELAEAIDLPQPVMRLFMDPNVLCTRHGNQFWTRRGMFKIQAGDCDNKRPFLRMDDQGIRFGTDWDSIGFEITHRTLQLAGLHILKNDKVFSPAERYNIEYVMDTDSFVRE